MALCLQKKRIKKERLKIRDINVIRIIKD